MLFFVIASALLGFTQVPIQSAYAGAVGKSCENVEHWNKIRFISSQALTNNEQLPIQKDVSSYEVLVRADADKAPLIEFLVSEKLNQIGYTRVGGAPVLLGDVSVLEITYSSFCLDENDFMQVVGGMLLQPDSATLLIAYGIANSIWIVPSVAGIGIAVYLVKRRF